MEKRLKNKRGITLIALVVTIIILIILAGISINLVLGDNGIIKKARYAKDREGMVGLREEAEMILAKREMDRIDGDTIALKEELEQRIQGDKIVEEAKVGDTVYPDTCYVTRNGYTITVYEDGTAEEGRIEIWDGSSKSKPKIDENRNWHIYTASEMKYFADFVNGYLTEEEKGDLTIENKVTIVYLENNLDLGARQVDGVLQKGTEWEPIGGHYATKLIFNATFEGNGHSIKGVYINSEEEKDHVGLFGSARIIQNLTIKDSYIKGIGMQDENNFATIGGIVGDCMQIINCHNVNTEVSGVKYVGGVAGWSMLIEDCSNSGNISGEEYCIGGIAEYADEIKRCYNSGKVTGKDELGGIAGACCNISECENTGEVNGNSWIGGISGYGYEDGIISKSYNRGKVTGESNVGGVMGWSLSPITLCVNDGEVKSNGLLDANAENIDSRVGGIVGTASGEEVSYCSNTGLVLGKGYFVGGIVGLIPTDGSDPSEKIGTRVEYCNNSGMIKGEGQGTGGIVGQVAQYKSSIQACYNSGTIEGNTWTGGLAGGVGRSSSVMNSWNKGDVKGNKQVGGLVGVTYNSSSTIKKCYTIGKINGVNEVGGVLGRKQNSEPMIENCYYLQGTVSESSNTMGEEKTQEQMKSQTFLDELNNGLEETVWMIESNKNEGYPILKDF